MPELSLGDRLRACRAEKGVAQEVAADEIGISRSYLAGLETDADKPGRDTLFAIANYYGVRVDWLATGEGERDPVPNTEEQNLLSKFRSLAPHEREVVKQVCDTLYRGHQTVEIDAGPQPSKKGARR